MRRILHSVLVCSLLLLPLSAASEEFHIVNGEPAADGAYPWMAAFLQDDFQACGGSLVAPNWILTASHCVADDRGQPSLTAAQASFRLDTTNWTDGSGETLTAAEIIIHPRYDAVSTDNDVALIRTNESSTITPVRIAGPGDVALNDPPTVGRVIGYGTTSSGGDASDDLLQVDVPVVSDAECAAGYGQLNEPNMVCAGDPSDDEANPGRDSCQGDSGGPLFAEVDGQPVQFGVVSFGIGCGAPLPGVYAQVTTYFDWITGIIGEQIQPGEPDPGPAGQQPEGGAEEPFRVAGPDPDSPVDNAIALSQLVFQTPGEFGVLAASANFPDALGGSALASYFGPLLYADADGSLGEATLREFRRALDPGSIVYILGGTAAVSGSADGQLAAAGFEVVRLAGEGRQQTARIVAEEVRNAVNGGSPPFDSVIVAFEGNWPDAVAVGSISAWFGIPVLLTPTATLGEPTKEYLETYQPSSVFVLGGEAVISADVREEIQQAIGEDGFVESVEGPTRLETAAEIAFLTQDLFLSNDEVFEFDGEPILEPEVLVAVNLRRDDAFAHVLAGSMVVGNFGGLFVPLEGDGTTLADSVIPSICGLDLEVMAIGGEALVADSAIAQIQEASVGNNCGGNNGA